MRRLLTFIAFAPLVACAKTPLEPIQASTAQTSKRNVEAGTCKIMKETGIAFEVGMSCAEFWQASYPKVHPCSQTERPEVCDALDAYRAVDWDAPQDMINTGHRGVWGMALPKGAMQDLAFDYRSAGYNTDTPQNTYRASYYARLAGISGVELDLMLMRDEGEPDPESVAFFGHYMDTYANTDWEGPYSTAIGDPSGANGALYNTNPSDFAKNHWPRIVRDKFGLLPEKPDFDVYYVSDDDYLNEHFYSPNDVRDLILYIDLKESKALEQFYVGPSGNLATSAVAAQAFPKDAMKERAGSIKSLLNSAFSLDTEYYALRAQAGIVFKSGVDVSADELSDAILATDFGKEFGNNAILVVPNLNITCTGQDGACTAEDRERELKRMDRYAEVFGEKGILYFETSYPSVNHWAAQPFTREVGGKKVEYKDITDYFKQRYNRRSAFWFPTATGLAGTHQQWKQMDKFYGSYPDWRRQGSRPGHQLGLMYYEPTYAIANMEWMTHAVSINERPEVYLQIRTAIIQGLKP